MFSHHTDRELDILVAMAMGLDVRPSYKAWMLKAFAEEMSTVRLDQHLAFSGPDRPFLMVEGKVVDLPFYSTLWRDGGRVIDSEEYVGITLTFSKKDGVPELRKMMLAFVEKKFPTGIDIPQEFKTSNQQKIAG